jgi:hypothetical protein
MGCVPLRLGSSSPMDAAGKEDPPRTWRSKPNLDPILPWCKELRYSQEAQKLFL